eukprot:11439814-Heterocapsa_arctica.AAC.1
MDRLAPQAAGPSNEQGILRSVLDKALQGMSDTMQANMDALISRLERIERVATDAALDRPGVRRAENAKLHHISLGTVDQVPRNQFVTVCGWRYGTSQYQLVEIPARADFCKCCFPTANTQPSARAMGNRGGVTPSESSSSEMLSSADSSESSSASA